MQNASDDNIEQAYQNALDVLYSTINFEEKPAVRYQASKIDTDRTRRLLELVGDPHLTYPSIHIAGTKGKGSAAAMCAAVLRAAGLKVGLFTSPHLRDVRERVRILTEDDPEGWIGKADFTALLELVGQYSNDFSGLTWFEIMTALAFHHFADEQVDIAVVEVGLGGRLDTTNVLTPLVSVITSLSLDHTALLGDTLDEIAFEKGGIIKPGVPVICAPQPEEALAVLRDLASERESPLILIGKDWQYQGKSGHLLITQSPKGSFVSSNTAFNLALAGEHQLENGAVALAALNSIKNQFPNISLACAQEGLRNVHWDGRLQTVYASDNGPTFLVDSAHNKDSALKLRSALVKDYDYENLWLIFGAPEDKAIEEMIAILFPLAKRAIVTAADHPRAVAPDRLVQMAGDQGYMALPVAAPTESLRTAFASAAPGDLILACGSIIFIGDLLNQWDRLKSELTAN